jgi:hypothetical protein
MNPPNTTSDDIYGAPSGAPKAESPSDESSTFLNQVRFYRTLDWTFGLIALALCCTLVVLIVRDTTPEKPSVSSAPTEPAPNYVPHYSLPFSELWVLEYSR